MVCQLPTLTLPLAFYLISLKGPKDAVRACGAFRSGDCHGCCSDDEAPDKFVERNRRSVGDVQARLSGAGRQPRKAIAMLAYQAAHAAPLRPEHKDYTLAKVQFGERSCGALVESANPKSRLLELLEGLGEIDHSNERYAFQGARGSLGERAANRRRTVSGENHGESAESSRRTQYRADILRVPELIERDDDTPA